MIAGVWFSYEADAPCLIESVRAFRRASPGSPVLVFDDAAKPIPGYVIDHIDPFRYEQTTWARRGNLNGWEAVHGILAAQQLACELTGASGSLKLDCDTVVLDVRWVWEEMAMVGWDAGQGRFALGMARFLRADVPGALLESSASRFLSAGPIPEDRVISAEALYEFPGECRIHPCRPTAAGFPRAGGWSYQQEAETGAGLIADESEYSVVTFGNRQSGCKKCDQREIAAVKMAELLTKTDPSP